MRLSWAAGRLTIIGLIALVLGACETVQLSTPPEPISLGGLGAPPPAAPERTVDELETQLGGDSAPETYVSFAPRNDRSRGQASRTDDGRFSVNFTDASLPEVVQTILGDLLGERFLLDPDVQGRVTVTSASPLGRDALLALLETSAASNGAMLSRRGDLWVIGLQSAGAGGGVLQPIEPGTGLTIVPLEHVSATDMVNLLQGAVGPADMMRADRGRNLVILRGSGPQRRAAVDLLASFDQQWARGRATALVPLSNASADQLTLELLSAMEANEGEARAGALRAQPIDRLNAVLVVAGSNALLREARGWIDRLDVAVSNGAILRSYAIENGDAATTATLLSDLFGLEGAGAGGGRPASVAADLDTGTVSSDAAQSRRAATRAAGALPRGLTGLNIRLTADPLNNALLVLASPAGHALVERALEMVDRPPAQVLLDAMIAEVTLNDTLRYGVQWFFETNGIDGIADTGRGGFGVNGFDADGTFPGFNFLLESQDNARFAVDALSAVTDLRVVSSPSIVVLNNRTATLNVGDQVPIVTRSSSSVVDPDSPIVNSVEFRDTGVILTVTPQVSSTGNVTLEIDQEVSNVSTRTSTGGAGGNPTISQRNISTSVTARSGQTIALGGLIGNSRDSLSNGVPGLARLPVVGAAFRNDTVTEQRTELLIFITPTILYDDQGAASVMQELGARFELMGPQAEANED